MHRSPMRRPMVGRTSILMVAAQWTPIVPHAWLLLATLVMANLVAAAPARISTRTRAVRVLRAE